MSFFTNNSMMKGMRLLEKGVDAAVLRRKVLANNVANVDVPHFKRSELSFEAELKRNLEMHKAARNEAPLRTTHPRHIQQHSYPPLEGVQPRVHIDYASRMRNDGNNVDIEDEVSKLVRNQLQYSLMVDRLSAGYRHLNGLLRPSL